MAREKKWRAKSGGIGKMDAHFQQRENVRSGEKVEVFAWTEKRCAWRGRFSALWPMGWELRAMRGLASDKGSSFLRRLLYRVHLAGEVARSTWATRPVLVGAFSLPERKAAVETRYRGRRFVFEWRGGRDHRGGACGGSLWLGLAERDLPEGRWPLPLHSR